MMKTLPGTSQCQHSQCCLLTDREHLPLLIHQLLRHRLRLCPVRLLLRYLRRLLRLLLIQLLKVLLLLQLKRPDSTILNLSNHFSHNLTSNLHSILQHYLHRQALRRHCQNRQRRLHRRNQRQRSRTSRMMMRTRTWIYSIRRNLRILLFYFFQNSKLLLSWIWQVDRVVAPTAKPLRHQLLLTQNKVMIRHVRLAKRNLLFLNHLLIHLRPRLAVHLLPLLSSTRTLPEHIFEFILSLVTLRTSCSGVRWGNTILYFGWTTQRKRPPTTHLT